MPNNLQVIIWTTCRLGFIYASIDLNEYGYGLTPRCITQQNIVRTLCVFLNPLRAIFFRENINIYLHFVSFRHIDATQVVEILPQIRQEPTCST